MDDNELAAFAAMHIKLDAICAKFQRMPESPNRVFRGISRSAAMRDGKHADLNFVLLVDFVDGVDGKQIAIAAAACDHAMGRARGIGMVAEILALMNIGEMHLDDRHLDG